MFNFYAPISKRTSYGLVAINLIENFSEVNPVIPIGGQVFDKFDIHFNKCLNAGKLFGVDIPCVKLYHQFAMADFIGKGQRIGFPIFELNRFNEIEEHHLCSLDGIMVTSEWARSIIKEQIGADSHVVPLGVDRDIFHEVQYIPQSHVFFSAGKWEVRKSQDEIVEAFNKAFDIKDNVELWMSFHNPFYPVDFINNKRKEYSATKMGHKIKFVGPFETQQDLCRIMNMSSCGVFPSKAEGWGLETLEMMACGKPVIVTNYAGHTEYCNDQNSILLPQTKLVSAHDNKWFFGQGDWAEININDLIESLRLSFKSGYTINMQGIETSKEFSWKNSSQILETIVETNYV